MTAFWHPFADMGAVEQHAMEIASGDGVWVTGSDGRRYLDATASLWCCNLGHNRAEINAAIAAQLEQIDSYSCFGDFTNAQAERLCERLAAVAPHAGSKVFLGSGGGDMIDSAAKIARAWFAQRGEPGRQHLIGRTNGYHGTHGFGTSVGGIEANQTGFGTIVGAASQIPFDSADALAAEIERVGPERVAAFFCEPVIGAGGVHLPPDGYLERTAEICREYGVLFVADCVIAGFGRLGTWFGVDRWGIEPDMITLAKGITGGVLPLGALVVSPQIAEPFFTGEPGAPVLRHGATYGGHPTCCAAANAALDIYETGVLERGRLLEGDLEAALRSSESSPLVGQVRAGTGLIGAVELDQGVLAARPDAPLRLALACREEGVLVRPLGRGVAVSPPLPIEAHEIELIGTAIGAGLERLGAAT
ncbi:MAG: aspartate aminotransferase family protein [Baekduia sp.]